MDITYNYEIVHVDEQARVMEIKYTHAQYGTVLVGARLPFEEEAIEDVIDMFSPAIEWAEQSRNVKPVAKGLKGQRVNSVLMPTDNTIDSFTTLSYVPGQINQTRIVNEDDNTSSLYFGDMLWMNTGSRGVIELASQLQDASGNVLVMGLGLGIVALVAAQKPEVTSVTVVELSQDVIDLFMMQGFDLSKITIVKGDAASHVGHYNTILADHYNIMGRHTAWQELVAIKNGFTATADTYNFYLWQLATDNYAEYRQFCRETGQTEYSPEDWQVFSKFDATADQKQFFYNSVATIEASRSQL